MREKGKKKNQLLYLYTPKYIIGAAIDKNTIIFTCFVYGDYGCMWYCYSGLTQEEEMNPFYKIVESYTFLDSIP